MTTHEMLKEICDKIGYDLRKGGEYWVFMNNYITTAEYGEGCRIINEREIIFTQEFMDKYLAYAYDNSDMITDFNYFCSMLISHKLTNPTEFLYNLIK